MSKPLLLVVFLLAAKTYGQCPQGIMEESVPEVSLNATCGNDAAKVTVMSTSTFYASTVTYSCNADGTEVANGTLIEDSTQMLVSLSVGRRFDMGTVCTFTGCYHHQIANVDDDFLIPPSSCTYDNPPATITLAPENVTAPLGTNASFLCEGVADEFLWNLAVDTGMTQITAPFDGLGARGIFSTLTAGGSELIVLASEENNGAVVECIAFIDFSDTAKSPPATLTVFGFPEAPTGLNATSSAPKKLQLTWDRLSSFPEEQLTYTLQVRNLATSIMNLYDSILQPELLFAQTDEDATCVMYEFIVFGVNVLGMGDPSASVQSTIPIEPGEFGEISITVNFGAGGVGLRFQFEPPLTCEGFPVTSYSIIVLADSRAQSLGPFTPSSTGGPEVLMVDPTTDLATDKEYVATITAVNAVGDTESNGITFYTTDVQTIDVEITTNSLQITCTFAQGSNAQGCFVEFFDTADSAIPLFDTRLIRQPGASEVTTTVGFNGELRRSYEVVVRDVEEGGTLGAFFLRQSVPVINVMPTSVLPQPSSSSSSSSSSDISPEPSVGVTEPRDSGGDSIDFALYIIVGCIVGGCALLAIAIFTLAFALGLRRRKVKVELSTNVAYGECEEKAEKDDTRPGRTPSHAYTREPTNPPRAPSAIYEAIPGALNLPPPIPTSPPPKSPPATSPTSNRPPLPPPVAEYDLALNPTYGQHSPAAAPPPTAPPTANGHRNSTYEVMKPVGKVQVTYAVPTGKVTVPVTIPGSPPEQQNHGYEVLVGQGRLASVTSGSAAGSATGSVVAANPQYGEFRPESEPQGGSVAENPQYAAIPRQDSVSNTYDFV